jgi:hypothetical protein
MGLAFPAPGASAASPLLRRNAQAKEMSLVLRHVAGESYEIASPAGMIDLCFTET